ncbi:type II toxin-antitoxin system RelB/DinJ family antitoxin [Candidatus Thiothrix sp. Deng01]|uniref:Type II toxin-antitoxin system RelB/DinJ family antitoxin n=1 Tax=Candidatus Thiothrix phosphatis TaxID=3112415 RepID=A0ABU6D0A7_9GAMM|nr:type II toxin-antitoxin system RelB/DinJ family antitoxin [Candidatus Thiothrix sp. Deng01]MEB4592509.1 type II toxin-antitoxin system RelB/DinJ family antitoxin [Candidatus Thiothrix sp. Deng01]
MSRSAIITTRVDPELKANAEQVLAQLGMTTAQAITMFLKQIELQRGLPFTPRLPTQNVQTHKPFKVETFSLGSDTTPDRDELYTERGL